MKNSSNLHRRLLLKTAAYNILKTFSARIFLRSFYAYISVKLWVLACSCRIEYKKSEPEVTIYEIEIGEPSGANLIDSIFIQLIFYKFLILVLQCIINYNPMILSIFSTFYWPVLVSKKFEYQEKVWKSYYARYNSAIIMFNDMNFD